MENKYYRTFPEYLEDHPEIDEKQAGLMATKVQTYEEMMFTFVMFLCI